ncbi:MAG: hypothetical protein OXF41_12500 [bacterium]|nr:hypothetical protein [bacterium]
MPPMRFEDWIGALGHAVNMLGDCWSGRSVLVLDDGYCRETMVTARQETVS